MAEKRNNAGKRPQCKVVVGKIRKGNLLIRCGMFLDVQGKCPEHG